MEQLIINSHNEFAQYIGKTLGTSQYVTVTQEMINKFAEATYDHQWIHTDPERAAKESPFGSTIAHGYLTLSLITHLWYDLVKVNNIKMLVNYGIENLKFCIPVTVDSEVRIITKLENIVNLRGISKASMHIKMEIKGERKPAFDGTVIFLYHFE